MHYFFYTSFPVNNLKINFDDPLHVNLIKFTAYLDSKMEPLTEVPKTDSNYMKQSLKAVFPELDTEDLNFMVEDDWYDISFRKGESFSVEENFKNDTFEWIMATEIPTHLIYK